MVPITGRASSVLQKNVCTYVIQKQNRKEKEEETEQKQTYQFTTR